MKWPWWKPLVPSPHQYQAAQFCGLEPDEPIGDDVAVIKHDSPHMSIKVPFLNPYVRGMDMYQYVTFHKNLRYRYSPIQIIQGQKYTVDWNTPI